MLGPADAADAFPHAAPCPWRSGRTMRLPGTGQAHTAAYRASAPAPSAVSVRFQFVVIVFVSRGFPLLFRLLLQPGVRFPDCVSGSSFRRPFDRVQVSENHVQHEAVFNAACAASVRSVRRPARSSPPCPAPLLRSPVSVRTARLAPSGVSGLPPGSCLLFRSFAVRFVHGSFLRFVLCSVCLVFRSIPVRFRFACPVRFVSAGSCSPLVHSRLRLSVSFLSLSLCCARSQAI